MLIACFKFIKLTTARSAECVKEVGIRKVVGAGRVQLTATVYWRIRAGVHDLFYSYTGCGRFITSFSTVAGKTLSKGNFDNSLFIGILLLATIRIGLLAGIYPALVLSSFKPITVLKGQFCNGTKGLLFRKGLVIAQFTISIVLIIGTIMVYTQLKFMRDRISGFNKNQTLVIDTHGTWKDAFQHAMSWLASVRPISSSVPGRGYPGALCQKLRM